MSGITICVVKAFLFCSILMATVSILFSFVPLSELTRIIARHTLETLTSQPLQQQHQSSSPFRPSAATNRAATTLGVSIRDRSITLSPHADMLRLWLTHDEPVNDPKINRRRNNSKAYTRLNIPPRPPVKILLTSFGWNHVNQTFALTMTRSTRSREFVEAIVNHPWFDIHGWDDILSGKQSIEPYIRYYVFLDVETCFEQNYPRYGWNYAGTKFQSNADLEHGRVALTATTKLKEPCRNLYACPFLDYLLLDVKLFQQAKHRAKLIYLDCSNFQANHRDFRKNNPWTLSSLVLVSIAATVDQLIPESGDQGLPPPAIHPLQLSPRQELSLQTCQDDMDDSNIGEGTRPYLLTFTGVDRNGSPRQALVRLDQGQDPDLHLRLVPGIKGNQSAASLRSNQELLIKSVFAAAPRGDSPFSYRFTEILSAGAIPVVHSDGGGKP